jgi:hypothetical protein
MHEAEEWAAGRMQAFCRRFADQRIERIVQVIRETQARRAALRPELNESSAGTWVADRCKPRHAQIRPGGRLVKHTGDARMKNLTIALAAAGMLVLSSAYAADQGSGQPSGGSQQDSAAQSGDAADRTTQGNEPGAGVRRGSNEGGTGRETTAEQPTATPGTGDTSEPNRGAGVGEARTGSESPGGASPSSGSQSGDTADQSSGAGQKNQSGQGSSGGASQN